MLETNSGFYRETENLSKSMKYSCKMVQMARKILKMPKFREILLPRVSSPSTLDPTVSEDDLWFKAFQYCDKKHRDDSVLPFGLGSMNQNFSGYLAFFMVIGLPLFIGLWKWGRKPLAEFLE